MTDINWKKKFTDLEKEKKLNDEFMEKLLTKKTNENFKLRQKIHKIKNDTKSS